MLAACGQPIPKEFALDLAGVDIETIDSDTVRKINDILSHWQQGAAHELHGDATYFVPGEELQQEVIARIAVDSDSVFDRIGDVAMRELEFDE